MLEKGIIIVADSGNTLGLLIDYPVKYENVIFVLALNNLTLDPSFMEWQCWKYLGIINKNPIKKFSWMQENFFIGNIKGEGRCITYGKR